MNWRTVEHAVVLCAVLLPPQVGCRHVCDYLYAPPPPGICEPIALPQLPPLPALPTQLPERPAAALLSFDAVAPAGREPLPAGPGVAPAEPIPAPRPLRDPTAAKPSPSAALELSEVLLSVGDVFPLLVAIEQEQALATGRRLSAEGAFDLTVRSRLSHQEGPFANNRFDLSFEQPTSWQGASFFGGYRCGLRDFPVYYGDRLTADAGEYRVGMIVSLLRDGPIDRRRAQLAQARLGEPLADAIVQQLRIDIYRAAAHSYWNWVAAGQQYLIANELLRIAGGRQAGLEQQFREGQIAEFVVIDNRRLIVERQGLLVAAERRLQQTALELSLYLRDEAGNPVTPSPERLPRDFVARQPPQPRVDQLSNDIAAALQMRPELARFSLLKEQLAVETQWARNQQLPGLNVVVSGSQDTGPGKQSDGIFALDRSTAEAALLFDVPLQRRDAAGRLLAAQAGMVKLLAEERFARDRIVVSVQDAVSNLDRVYARLEQARAEQQIAQRVAELELERFTTGQGALLEVNLRELAAAGAQSKVVDALAEFYRALADYRAALGLDADTDANDE